MAKSIVHGYEKSRAEKWLKAAVKNDRDRIKEMAGEWILAEPPWWTQFQRPTWRIAMRLSIRPHDHTSDRNEPRPAMFGKKQDGTFCLELLDAHGQHAQVCKVEDTAVQRHDTIRDGIVPELKSCVTSVKLEQFIYELDEG